MSRTDLRPYILRSFKVAAALEKGLVLYREACQAMWHDLEVFEIRSDNTYERMESCDVVDGPTVVFRIRY